MKKPYYLVNGWCLTCNKKGVVEGNEVYDPCIGKLPNIINACCGHGHIKSAYIQFKDKTRIAGQHAINKMKELTKNI